MNKEDPEKLIPVPGQPRAVRQRDVQAALTERSVLYQLIPGQRIRGQLRERNFLTKSHTSCTC